MPLERVGLLHPGEMGAAVGAVLTGRGRRVVWASEGRSTADANAGGGGWTRGRRERGGGRDSDVVLSICPPHAALDVAKSVAGFEGLFVDANAVAPATARAVAAVIEDGGGRFVDGGIIGPPPRDPGLTRLYLSGAEAATVADLFAGSSLDARPVSTEIGVASAVKMAYAAWTKGSAALLLAIRELARAEGVEATLLDEWDLSLPDLAERSQSAARSAQAKGWRWVAEMEEIAATFSAAGQPAGFHEAAAEVFRAWSREPAPR